MKLERDKLKDDLEHWKSTIASISTENKRTRRKSVDAMDRVKELEDSNADLENKTQKQAGGEGIKA